MIVKLQRKNCPSFCNPCNFCHYFDNTGNPKCKHPEVENVDCVVEDVVYVKVDESGCVKNEDLECEIIKFMNK